MYLGDPFLLIYKDSFTFLLWLYYIPLCTIINWLNSIFIDRKGVCAFVILLDNTKLFSVGVANVLFAILTFDNIDNLAMINQMWYFSIYEFNDIYAHTIQQQAESLFF